MRHIVLSCPNVMQDSTNTSKNIPKAKLFSFFVTGNETCPQTVVVAPWDGKVCLGGWELTAPRRVPGR